MMLQKQNLKELFQQWCSKLKETIFVKHLMNFEALIEELKNQSPISYQ